MSHAAHHDPTVPPAALKAAALLIVTCLVMTGAVRLGWLDMQADPIAQRAAAGTAMAETRDLVFADRDDGAVVVRDASDGALVTEIPSGEGGFVRAILRGMAKTRIQQGLGPEQPFRLILWENGALSLRDPATGREAELHGFGATNRAIFEDMLKGGAA